MPRRVSLPPQFAWLAGQVDYVQEVSKGYKYTSTCPQCGGSPHPDGEWPDRFVIWIDEKPLGWCSRCGHMRFADQGGEPPDPEELERWRKKQKRIQEERKRRAEQALKLLRRQEIHRRYHEALKEHDCDYWQRVRHLDEFWTSWWRLGYNPKYRLWADSEAHYVPTATIPLLDPETGQLLNVKHRMMKEEDTDWGKYRYEIGGQPAPLFVCNLDEPLDGHVIAVEGEIKAMVTFATMDESNVRMVGLPGATPGQHIVDALSDADKITLVMDPGARKQAWELATALGKERVWVVLCPMKIDDGIVQEGLDAKDVRWMIKQSVWAGG